MSLPLAQTFTAGDTDYVAKLQTLSTGVDSLYSSFQASLAGGSFGDTSASSNSVAAGSKTFTVSSGKSFLPGMPLMIARTSAPSTTYMYGLVTSYSGTTLIVSVSTILGSGTYTDWTISLVGLPGGILPSTAKTTSFTAVAGNCYIIDGNSIVVTLPTTASLGDTITFVAGNSTFTGFSVGRNGLKIMGLAEDMTVDITFFPFTLRYYDATNGWRFAK